MIQKQYPHFRKVAVLGAGVMGAQIAALFANAKIEVLLFELAGKEGNPNVLAEQAIQKLKTLSPSPFVSTNSARAITPANYNEHLELLKECDFVLEAIAERFDWKVDLYKKIGDYLKEGAFVASNTSGLSITQLAEVLPSKVQSRFCGVHFFNPPRYMTLVELVPHPNTAQDILNGLESFLVSVLGKGVIRVKDTPNFLANRIGVFSLLTTLHHAKTFELPISVVDQLTGPFLGRPKSATYRTLDVVGLDTMAHVVRTMQERLKEDPWYPTFKLPQEMAHLIEQGALGQKTKRGFYRKQGEVIEAFDPKTKTYQPISNTADPEVLSILKKKEISERLKSLRESSYPQAQFLWGCYRDVFHYCAFHLADIADTVRDLDLAMRWGFGWKEGPFETWQKAGWKEVTEWLAKDIKENQSLSKAALPSWVAKTSVVYQANAALSPKTQTHQPRSKLPVYQRQLYPDPVLEESFEEGQTLFENEAVRLWQRREEIAVLSFKSQLGSISHAVLEGILSSIEQTQRTHRALVIWQRQGNYFSVGANLKEVVKLLKEKSYGELEGFIERFQEATLAVRYAHIPVVVAMQGYALGGGCELMLHAARRVAAMETYTGLVEVGVGLIPAGGGTKEMVVQAMQEASWCGDLIAPLKMKFKLLLQMFSSKSATEAFEKGLLWWGDIILMNPAELLYVSEQQALALAESCYRPPLQAPISVAGKKGMSELKALCDEWHEKKLITTYDQVIGYQLAEVLCGGSVEFGSTLTEPDILELEKDCFMELVHNAKTLERIEYMLKTGKRLLN